MPKRSTRRRRRSQGCLSFAISALAIIALALAAAIVVTNRWLKPADSAVTAQDTENGNYVDANDPPVEEHQLVLNADSFARTPVPEGFDGDGASEATPESSPTPEPTDTPEPTFNPDDPYALVRPQPAGEGMVPVFRKANTEEKRIAITVDECSGVTITTDFAKKASNYGAKLTLFPTGDNVMKKGMGDVLKRCLFQMGFEIENRCYSSTARLYKLNDVMMATEIWKQNMALNYTLGVKYRPHFLRLYGGSGENDRRTYAYLIQEGYLGIANWTISASETASDRIADTLAPGNIYYFKTTQDDLRKMELLLQEVKRQGYEAVTLNALFGYEENVYEDAENSVLSETLPELQDYDNAYYFVRTGDHTWLVNRIQMRLTELGYLPPGSADGIFGNTTAAALSAFQAKCGLAATGAADVETQERLFAQDAPPMQN